MPQLNEGDLMFMPIAEQGFQPAEVSVKRGGPVRLTFVRTTDNTCAKEIVVPSLEIRRPLPLNEPVVVEFTPREAATVEFTCGSNSSRRSTDRSHKSGCNRIFQGTSRQLSSGGSI